MHTLIPRLRADVAALATPAGRMVGATGHAEARRFLRARLAGLRLEPYPAATNFLLPYRCEGQEFFNLAGVLPGTDRKARPILLGAHYDSRDLPKAAEQDTAEFEIALLEASFGRWLPLAGLRKLATRADLDALAARLAGLGL